MAFRGNRYSLPPGLAGARVWVCLRIATTSASSARRPLAEQRSPHRGAAGPCAPRGRFSQSWQEQWHGGRAQVDFKDLCRDDAMEYRHPTQKPVKLLEESTAVPIRSNSTRMD